MGDLRACSGSCGGRLYIQYISVASFPNTNSGYRPYFCILLYNHTLTFTFVYVLCSVLGKLKTLITAPTPSLSFYIYFVDSVSFYSTSSATIRWAEGSHCPIAKLCLGRDQVQEVYYVHFQS